MKFALLGNPNTGKSSVFNMLTGLRQHVGNFPGVTVDKKEGTVLIENVKHTLIDFPGTYSLYPRSKDESVVYKNLVEVSVDERPDALLVVVDASNIERNLFYFSQIYDLGLPIFMVLNMSDVAVNKGIIIDINALQNLFPEAVIIETNARIKAGRSELLESMREPKKRESNRFLKSDLASITDTSGQEIDTKLRSDKIHNEIHNVIRLSEKSNKTAKQKIDNVLVHPIFGYLIFAAILMIMFQFIYSFAEVPMNIIDGAFANLASWSSSVIPAGIFNDLLTQGIIPGIGGVVVFIPQIALLFFFISILEESGYLSRVVFIMDRLMRPFGLNGKSIVPLLSSAACAIPGVMAARTISDWKERLITILVAPLMSCSARIPVYTVLIAVVIPNEHVGIFNLQGLVLFGLYALGVIFALSIALVLKFIIKSERKGFLLLELPAYKTPNWKNVGITVWEKVRIFVVDAGKIILAISIILWALATYGPSDRMNSAELKAREESSYQELDSEQTEQLVSAYRLEESYIGILGRTIEPVIQPLGYDWKIGISLITSFAAREVFVGSMATIYAVQNADDSKPLIEKMKLEKRKDGTPVYTVASGVSLMVFYAFAMMCMATLAVVKRETKSWKWPIIQMSYMGTLAYVCAWLTYIILA